MARPTQHRKTPRQLLAECFFMAANDDLKIYRIGQRANHDADLIARAHDLLVDEWNHEIRNDNNRYGHHGSPKTINRALGIMKALAKAHGDAEERAYRRGRGRAESLSRSRRDFGRF